MYNIVFALFVFLLSSYPLAAGGQEESRPPLGRTVTFNFAARDAGVPLDPKLQHIYTEYRDVLGCLGFKSFEEFRREFYVANEFYDVPEYPVTIRSSTKKHLMPRADRIDACYHRAVEAEAPAADKPPFPSFRPSELLLLGKIEAENRRLASEITKSNRNLAAQIEEVNQRIAAMDEEVAAATTALEWRASTAESSPPPQSSLTTPPETEAESGSKLTNADSAKDEDINWFELVLENPLLVIAAIAIVLVLIACIAVRSLVRGRGDKQDENHRRRPSTSTIADDNAVPFSPRATATQERLDFTWHKANPTPVQIRDFVKSKRFDIRFTFEGKEYKIPFQATRRGRSVRVTSDHFPRQGLYDTEAGDLENAIVKALRSGWRPSRALQTKSA